MTATVSVRHNFESAHRLPHLPGKCQSLHGHSWWVDLTVTGETGDDGVLVEFGPFKTRLRQWIDGYLDHGVILGERDPLGALLPDFKTKVFTMRDWPTVENVAALLAEVGADVLCQLGVADKVRVGAVEVHETYVNRAGWRP